MPSLIRAIISFLMLVASCFAYSQAGCPLKSTVATYDFFSRYKHIGDIKQTIHVTHKRFSIATKKDTGFFMSKRHTDEESRGVLDSEGLQPTSYQSTSKAMVQRWSFLPDKMQIQGTMNKQFIRQSHKIWPIYDRNSYLLALRCALLAGDFKQRSYHVFDLGRLSHYSVSVMSKNKKIQTKLGPLSTTELRVLVAPDAKIYLLWFANTMNDLLVQRSTIAGSSGTSFSSIDQVQGA